MHCKKRFAFIRNFTELSKLHMNQKNVLLKDVESCIKWWFKMQLELNQQSYLQERIRKQFLLFRKKSKRFGKWLTLQRKKKKKLSRLLRSLDRKSQILIKSLNKEVVFLSVKIAPFITWWDRKKNLANKTKKSKIKSTNSKKISTISDLKLQQKSLMLPRRIQKSTS